MKIVFTPNQTRQLLAWAANYVRFEVDEGILPSGVRIIVELAPPFGSLADAQYGEARLELGEVEVER